MALTIQKTILALLMLLVFSNQNEIAAQGLTVASSKKKAAESASDESTESEEEKTDDAKGNEDSNESNLSIQGITFSNPEKNKWKVGVKAIVGSGSVRNAVFTFPIPKNWPEQSVSMVEDEIPTNAIIGDGRKIDQGLDQLVVRFPYLAPRQEVLITKTFLVSTSQIDAPKETSGFIKPKSRNSDARKYLRPSPGINFQNSKLKRQVKELATDKKTAWEEIEAIYDWVRDNIEDTTNEPRQIANVFQDKTGCNEDKVCLFVGMCRANKVPARMVWVQGTIYAEFMLVDPSGKTHWFPCNIGGIREFGSYAEPRIILQKGDNFRVPEKEKTLKYVGEVFQGTIQKGQSRPVYKFFTQLLPADE